MLTNRRFLLLASLTLTTVFGLLFQLGCSSDNDEDTSTDSDTGSDTDTDTDTDSDTGTGEDVDTDYECEPFSISVSLSSVIGTVGIVEWSVDGVSVSSARIEFGTDESYGKEAPVDLDEPNYRTLLLGMKPSTEYHFRVVVNDGSSEIESCDCVVTTGPGPNGLPYVYTETSDAEAMLGGFTITEIFTTCQTFILDEDGEVVWWYLPNLVQCSRARMSYDGKHMLLKDVNLNNGNGSVPAGRILKISMDGLEEETISLPNAHHDFTLLSDGTIGFIDYDSKDGECDNIMEMDAKGNITEIFHLADAITPPPQQGPYQLGQCHSNIINYWPDDDSYTISVLNKDQIIKVNRSGDLMWILGGDENTFTGDDLIWEKQHGHHLYDGKILFFNNGNDNNDPSRALIYTLDETNQAAELIWEYESGSNSISMGDAQHLPNGNTLITYSNEGTIIEVTPDQSVVQLFSWGAGGALGFAMRRESLYGPPPK